MADVHSKAVRSYNMSRIRGKDTKPEMLVRKFLFVNGYRYRLHDKRLPGKPDIILPKYKTVIFVHGCFWHQHKDCKNARKPSSNTEYWTEKLKKNTEKDALHVNALIALGWKVLTIWECEISKDQQHALRQLVSHF